MVYFFVFDCFRRIISGSDTGVSVISDMSLPGMSIIRSRGYICWLSHVISLDAHTMAAQTLWHRRVAKQAIRSASRQEAIRTGVISLRVPKIAPLVLNTPAPAYNFPAETDIQPPSSPPPEFDTLEPGPRHLDYTPYVPGGLEYEPVEDLYLFSANARVIQDYSSERYDVISGFLSLGGDARIVSQVLDETHPTTIIELPPSNSCNFAYYKLLPPSLDPGPAAPLSYPLPYPLCKSVDCGAVEHEGVPTHNQGPYQDSSIPEALHAFLNSALEVHGLKDLFQGGSIPPPQVWNALHRIIDGTAETVNGPRDSTMSDWALIENFRAWHCFGHRSVEELYDILADDEDSEGGGGESEHGSKYHLIDADDDEDSESEGLSEEGARNWLRDLPSPE